MTSAIIGIAFIFVTIITPPTVIIIIIRAVRIHMTTVLGTAIPPVSKVIAFVPVITICIAVVAVLSHVFVPASGTRAIPHTAVVTSLPVAVALSIISSIIIIVVRVSTHTIITAPVAATLVITVIIISLAPLIAAAETISTFVSSIAGTVAATV